MSQVSRKQLLTSFSYIRPHIMVNIDEENYRPTLLSPPLTRVSKQVRADTLPMYFGKLSMRFVWRGNRKIWLGELWDLRDWLIAAGPDVAGSLGSVDIRIDEKGREAKDLEMLVRLGIRAERLQIEMVE